jgi:integrase
MEQKNQSLNIDNVTLCSDGRYLIRITVDGKRKSKWIPVSAVENLSPKQLKTYLEEERGKFKNKCYNNNQAPETFAVVADIWLETDVVGHFSGTTCDTYKGQLPRIKQAIGNIRMDKLMPYQLQLFINGLPTSVTDTNVAIIRHVCTFAKSNKMIIDNPAEDIKAMKHTPKPRIGYSREEIALLLEAVKHHSYPQLRVFVTLTAYSGMRTSEILGLAWKDIDFEAHTIYIHQQLARVSGKLSINPKTKNGVNRTITVSQEALNTLLDWKNTQGDECIAGMVFGDDGGHLIRYRITHRLETLCKKTGVPYRSPHAFRHFVASTMHSEGETLATIAEYIGDKIGTVSKYYLHAEVGATRHASFTLENAIEKSKKTKSGISLVSEKIETTV